MAQDTGTGRSNRPETTEGERALRAIPADHEAERAILGALLLDHDALYRVLDRVHPEDFDDPRHREVFEACCGLADKNQTISLITLRNQLQETDRLERAGGARLLASLADAVPTAAHVEHHARIVRDKALGRSLIRTCERIAAAGYDGAQPIHDLLEDAERKVLQIAMGHTESGFSALHDELLATYDYIEKVQAGQIAGIQTGFRDLDEKLGGLKGGDLVVLAARPSMGKTALALNIARNCTMDYGGCVGIFSLEMTKRQLALRLLLAEAAVDSSRFFEGYLGDRDNERLQRAARRLADARIFIDDTGMLSALDLSAKARRLHRDHHVSMIVVDYIQLIHSRSRLERREQEVAEITRLLKLLAKDLDVPVLALSQLNRAPELRSPPRPRLSDLRESGAIEQDADVVIFIYREDVYDRDSPDAGTAELIIDKHRNGPTGKVRLQFEQRYARFQDLAGGEPPPPEAGFDADAGADWGKDPEPPF